MPEPRPDPDPNDFLTPVGIAPKQSPGGVPSLTVMTGTAKGGGELIVSSDAMLVRVQALGRMSEALLYSAGQLADIMEHVERSQSVAANIPAAIPDARREMETALRALMSAQSRVVAIRNGIVRSQESYARTEQVAGAALHFIDEQVAWELGVLVHLAAVPIGFAAIEGLLGACVMFRLKPGDLAGTAQSFLEQHGRILTNPVSVAAIREIASDVDGFSAGFSGLPQPIADALEGSGVSGVKSSAAEVVEIANVFGLFENTPGVVARKTSSFEFRTPPRSLLDRANAFPDPHTDPEGEQIRIDRYVTPGQPDRFDVYIAGTVTFDPKTGGQPFDFTSDLRGVAGEPTASSSAVEQAMAKAGITSSSPVVLNGYSQGGLVASVVAATGKYNVKGVVTFGAPSGQVALPASVPVLSVRNSEDLVPATSGYDVNPHAVVVQRSVFANTPVPSEWAVPAHRLEYYQQTAAIVDTSGSPQLRAILNSLDSFGQGTGHVDSSLWVANRVDASGNILPIKPTPLTPTPVTPPPASYGSGREVAEQ